MNDPMNDSINGALERLRDITRILREPGGCDWDRAQDLFSMREYLLEEAAEVIDAITRRHDLDLKEELGDLLFLVFFLSRLNEEAGKFHLGDVASGMSEKLIRRHPHVFGDVKIDKVDDIVANWERIKEEEKATKADSGGDATDSSDNNNNAGSEQTPKRKSVLKDTKKFLPALSRAYKVQEKVAAVGFDWPDTTGVFDKIREEIAELEAEVKGNAGSNHRGRDSSDDSDDQQIADAERRRDRLEDEAGDLLFAFVNLMRHLKIHPEAALHRSVEKFARRFRGVEERLAEAGQTPAEATLAELDRLWDAVKASERSQHSDGAASAAPGPNSLAGRSGESAS